MSDDYGYFGKGIDGYVHYMQAFKDSKKGGGGGGRRPYGKGGAFMMAVFSAIILYLIIKY